MDFADAYLMTKLGHPELAGWWGKLLGGKAKTLYTIKPKQSGSGDPSPDNVRPILPGLTLTRDSGSTLTVYGGTLDVPTGTLTVDKSMLVCSSSQTWAKSKVVFSGGRCVFYLKGGILDCELSSDVGGDNNENGVTMLCSHYPIGDQSYNTMLASAEQFSMGIGRSAGYTDIGFLILDTHTGGTAEGFVAWLTGQINTGTPVQVVYPLKTSKTYQLTDAEAKRAIRSLTH